MTYTDTPATPDDGGSGSGKLQDAREQASNLGSEAASAGQRVAGVAKDEVGNVASEAKYQAKDLLHQARTELTEQAGAQQERVAGGLRSLSDELNSMAQSSEGGMAADLVRQVATRAGDVAGWLDQRDPGSLLQEVQDFARRKPGVFIAGAALAGILAGRLTRSLSGGSSGSTTTGGSTGASADTTPTTDLTGTTGAVGDSYAGGSTYTPGNDGTLGAGVAGGVGSAGAAYAAPATATTPVDDEFVDERPASAGAETPLYGATASQFSAAGDGADDATTSEWDPANGESSPSVGGGAEDVRP